MSRWFVSATFVICIHNFPRGEVSVKVGVMEFGLNSAHVTTSGQDRRADRSHYQEAAFSEVGPTLAFFPH